MSLAGYVNVLSRALNWLEDDLFNDFKAAHYLHYVTIFTDQDKRLYLREGEKRMKRMKLKLFKLKSRIRWAIPEASGEKLVRWFYYV